MEKERTIHGYRKPWAKLFLIMRLSILLFFAFVVASQARSFSQSSKLTLDLSKVKLIDVLSEIEDQTDYYFYFNLNLDNYQVNQVVAENQDIRKVLDDMLPGLGLAYEIVDRYIVIKHAGEKTPGNFIHNGTQQKVKIYGKVTDISGAPLPGVTVVVKSSSTGTITDSEGNYSLDNLFPDAVIVFSFVGMKTQETPVWGKKVLDVVMSEEFFGIDEVVAIGYGTMKKSDLTGAVASISADDFKSQPIIKSTDALQGRVAGVTVSNVVSGPGGETKIRIRGTNSLSGSNDPLYVVDGVALNSIGDLPVEDIESIEVLKDASSTAIYGSRGANGVVLITTKRGKSGVTRIEFNSFGSINKLANKYDLIDGYPYALYINDSYGDIYNAEALSAFQKNGGVDWQDQIFRTGVSQNYQLSASGGKQDVRYYVSASYKSQDGVLINTNDEQFSFRSNIDVNLRENLKLGVDVFGRRYKCHNSADSGSKNSPVFGALVYSPTMSIYDADGNYIRKDNYGAFEAVINPYMNAMERNEDRLVNTVTANLNLNWEFMKGLSADYHFAMNYYGSDNSSFTNSWMTTSETSGRVDMGHSLNWMQNLVLNYNTSFNEKHKVTLTGVVEQAKWESKSNSASASGFTTEALTYHNLGIGSIKGASSGYAAATLLSYIGRAGYNFDDRYLFTATFRADGSSKFSQGNKWGYFPSFAAAWKVSEESFISDLDIFDNLKIRGSWGKTGSQAVSNYATETLLTQQSAYYGTTSTYVGYYPTTTNQNLKWEETTQYDLGLDMGFWNNRFTVSLDYYNKDTDNLLLEQATASFAGGGDVWVNAGKMRNKGFEAVVGVVPIEHKKDFSWNITGNLAINRNEVISLDNEQELWFGEGYSALVADDVFIIREGEPMGSLYGYKWTGIWQSGEAAEAAKYGCQPGDNKYEDVDGNFKYDSEDKQIIGCGSPKFIWGLNQSLTYKKFDLNVFLVGSQGNDILNIAYASAATTNAESRTVTLREAFADAWTESNPSNRWSKLNSSSDINHMESSKYIQDGSYIRLRNVSLGYTFPRSMIKIGELRLYGSAQNLLTLSKYKGYDPEASSSKSSDTAVGVDVGVYPAARTYTFGLNLAF